jgi:hypothetical protein
MDDLVAAYPDKQLHPVMDNLNTYKKNDDWLRAHPNPTRASWLNQIAI